jgi:hypothetical protein
MAPEPLRAQHLVGAREDPFVEVSPADERRGGREILFEQVDQVLRPFDGNLAITSNRDVEGEQQRAAGLEATPELPDDLGPIPRVLENADAAGVVEGLVGVGHLRKVLVREFDGEVVLRGDLVVLRTDGGVEIAGIDLEAAPGEHGREEAVAAARVEDPLSGAVLGKISEDIGVFPLPTPAEARLTAEALVFLKAEAQELSETRVAEILVQCEAVAVREGELAGFHVSPQTSLPPPAHLRAESMMMSAGRMTRHFRQTASRSRQLAVSSRVTL